MKKITALAALAAVILAAAGCAGDDKPAETTAAQTPEAQQTAGETTAQTEAVTEDTTVSEESGTEDTKPEEETSETSDVMSYAEYAAADVDTPVTVITYIQAKQGWWTDDNGVSQASFYTQDKDGGYFLYNMPCTEEEYNSLTVGTGIKVSGFKSSWAGENEIIDSTFEILSDTYIAEPEDVTSLLGTDELENKQNKFVSFKGMTVEASQNAEGNDAAFLYKYDGGGEDGDDLYFKVSLDGNIYTFTVESYLCDNTTDVYKAVKELNIGDKIDLEGFLYWYEGANPHITSVSAAAEADESGSSGEEKPEGVMSYAEYAAADVDTAVTVVTYIQAKQGWWTDDNGVGQASFYTQDRDGGYFLYNMPCTEEEYNSLTVGTGIKVSGYKSNWAGENEIIDSAFEILSDTYIAEPEDVTSLLGTDELENKQNKFVSFKGMTVEASQNADGNDAAFLYKYDGGGEDGDDLYFKVSLDGNTYTFTVESYLCDNTTDVYKAVKELNIGDKIDLEGFLYWYEGANPHITSVSAAQ